jgi:hypothetical protein
MRLLHLLQKLMRRRRSRRVVYTCLFGYSERFNDFTYERDADVDFICFTDDPELRSEFWTIRFVPSINPDPAKAAKQVKALPHIFLPEYDCSLYIDNTVQLQARPRYFFDHVLAASSSPLVCFRHPERACVYDEADEVVRLGLDEPARVHEQMEQYRRAGYPTKNGLAQGSFLLRRHNDRSLVPVMNDWFAQVSRYSRRDQLALNPAMWAHGLEPTYIPLKFRQNDLLDWPVVKGNRLPRDFDDVRYLELNRDVQINPRRHFLYEGAAQGRRYK